MTVTLPLASGDLPDARPGKTGTAPPRPRLVVEVVVVTVAAVAAGVLVARHAADWRRIPPLLVGASPVWLGLGAWAEAASMAAAARQQRRLLAAAGVRVPLGRALLVTYAANAVSVTIPAGAAVAVYYQQREYRRYGASVGAGAAVALVGGALSADALVALGCAGVLLTPEAAPLWRWTAAGVGGGCVAFAVALGAALRRRRRRTRLRPVGERAPRRRLLRHLAEARALRPSVADWLAALGASLANWLADGLCLLACARSVGLEVPLTHLLAAYCAGQLLISAPLTPGGLAVAESGMTAVLVAFGVAATPALGAVLLYRLVSYWALLPVGAACAAALRRPVRAKNPQMRNSTVDLTYQAA